MEKVFQWISDKYMWVTSRIPLRLLHFVICFCVAVFSWELAVGLALGRESQCFNSVERIKDSLGDLLADGIGILLALAIKFIF